MLNILTDTMHFRYFDRFVYSHDSVIINYELPPRNSESLLKTDRCGFITSRVY